LARLARDAAQSKKAREVVVIDLRKKTPMADYFVICEGDTDRQTKAIAEAVREAASRRGIKPYHASGESDGTWILLDYIDVIVHIFLPGERAFYDLESLWATDRMQALSEERARPAPARSRRRSA
jgi:ribosome-associated protein